MMRFLLFVIALAYSPGAVCHGAAPRFADRVKILSDYHGFYPCGDCHYNQETNRRPRILQDEHEIPLEWADDAGEVHLVEFGERVRLADLLGTGAARGLRKENLARVGRRVDARGYMKAQGVGEQDSVWVLTHGGANIWCLDCHSADQRESLVMLSGELISFNESHRLCGQCHGPTLLDWDAGEHGRSNGYWNAGLDSAGVTTRLLCVECHNPHAPRFRGMTPLAGPVTRLDNVSHPAKGAHQVDEHKGERDDLGPQPWQKAPARPRPGRSGGRRP